VAARRGLAVPFGPSSGTPSILGVPNIGSTASTKHRTETTGMSAAVTPGWCNLVTAVRMAAAWRATESNSLDRSRPFTGERDEEEYARQGWVGAFSDPP